MDLQLEQLAVCSDENKDSSKSLWIWDEYVLSGSTTERTGNQYLVARIDDQLQYCSPAEFYDLIQCGKDKSKADLIKDHESYKYADGTPIPVVKFNGKYCRLIANYLQCDQPTEVPIVNPS